MMHGSRQQAIHFLDLQLRSINGLDGSFLTTATSNVIMPHLNKYNLFSSRPHLTKHEYSVLASYPGHNMVGGDTKR